MCLALLSYTDNYVPTLGEFVHHRIPFFFALLYFLFNIPLLVPEAYYQETSQTRTPRIWSARRMRAPIGAMSGTLATNALPSFRAAREVSIAPIPTSPTPPIDPDETVSIPPAEQSQFESASDERIEAPRPLTGRLVILLGRRKDLAKRFPEGKMLALLLHDCSRRYDWERRLTPDRWASLLEAWERKRDLLLVSRPSSPPSSTTDHSASVVVAPAAVSVCGSGVRM